MDQATEHDCMEHLRYESAESTEPHGERHLDERWTCTVCGEHYDAADLERMERV